VILSVLYISVQRSDSEKGGRFELEQAGANLIWHWEEEDRKEDEYDEAERSLERASCRSLTCLESSQLQLKDGCREFIQSKPEFM
jgi:hypothetical protein